MPIKIVDKALTNNDRKLLTSASQGSSVNLQGSINRHKY